MPSAVPSRASSFSRLGSLATALNTAQLSPDAHSTADSTPTLASASASPWKASEAISSETVKPTPAMAPVPATAAQPMGGRTRPRLIQVTTAAPAPVPIGLPTTYATRMPSVIGDVNASARKWPVITTSALARANSGTMT